MKALVVIVTVLIVTVWVTVVILTVVIVTVVTVTVILVIAVIVTVVIVIVVTVVTVVTVVIVNNFSPIIFSKEQFDPLTRIAIFSRQPFAICLKSAASERTRICIFGTSHTSFRACSCIADFNLGQQKRDQYEACAMCISIPLRNHRLYQNGEKADILNRQLYPGLFY